ncbi:MAG: MBL fold metallo-hydrolase [Clostridia bacterium]|nr:MBL fold metallo-hydrolase [Clostridia bacterium]
MSRICPLFSGSSGNSTYIGTQNGGILIDAGASFKGLCSALERAGGEYGEIKAVAVTHEHIDHICGLKTFLNKTDASLLASKQTLEALISADKVPKNTNVIEIAESEVDINGIIINRFATSHDCEGSSGYNLILPDGKKVSVCTDLGVVTDVVRASISKSDVILIESNHDIDMLKKGPYPPHLKMRIMSDKGHISNNTCAAEIKELFKGGTMRFILGHLSRNNNTPVLARSASESALMDLGAVNGKDYLLSVASPKDNGVIVI